MPRYRGLGAQFFTPPPQICPSWGCDGFHPIAFPGDPQVASGVDPTTGQVVSSIPPSGPLPPGAGFQQVEVPGPFPYVYIGGQQQQTVPLPPATIGGSSVANDPQYPGWNLQNPPSGSYQQTCRNIQSDGQGNLWAECETERGTWQPTNLFYGDCETSPYNQNGELGCGGVSGQIFTPTGSGLIPVPAPAWNVYTTYFPGQTVTYAGVTWTALVQTSGTPPAPGSGIWMMSASPYAASPYSTPFAQQTGYLPTGSSSSAVAASSGAMGSFTSWVSKYKGWLIGIGAAVIIVPRLLPKR